MAIQPYEIDGKTFYKIRVVRKSKAKGVSIDKSVDAIATLADAEKEEKKLIAKCERELILADARGSTFGELLDTWEVEAKKEDKEIFIQEVEKQTVYDYVFLIRRYCDHWMKLEATEIDRATAWMTLDQVNREVSITRRKRLNSAINAVYRWAMVSGRIEGLKEVPTYGYRSTKKEEEKMPEILNLQQIRTFLKVAEESGHKWYPIWALALFTGMRSGELYALKWDAVDLENKLVYVHLNWTNRERYGPTKGAYWRTVPIESTQVLSLLAELKTKGGNGDFVFPRYDSWRKGAQATILREFCIGHGLPSIKFHTLRACFATQLIRMAIAPGKVMSIGGWKDLKTMQRYIRMAGIEVKGATEGLMLLPDRQVMGKVVELFRTE